MQKIFFLFLFSGVLFLTFSVQAQAVDQLPTKSDPFWTVANQIHDPSDSTCYEKALVAYASYGPGAPTAATAACLGLQAMLAMEDVFEAEGIETNLFDDEITPGGLLDNDWRAIEGLYFELPGYGKITFTQPINFMSYDFLTFLSSLVSRMEMSKDYISLDADIVNGFAGYGAVLTMYNVSGFENPEILVNGGDDNEGIVSNLTYNNVNQTIQFSAQHFTSFKAVEKDGDDDDEAEKAKIDSWSAYRYIDKASGLCQEKVKVTIKGHRFDADAEVKIGSQEANRIERVSSRKIIGWFCINELLDAKVGLKRTVSVTNPHADKTNSFKKINLGNVPYKLGLNDFNVSHREGVMNIQKTLVFMGFLEERYITGFYGSITSDAVKKFQGKYTLPETGIFDVQTLEKMKKVVK